MKQIVDVDIKPEIEKIDYRSVGHGKTHILKHKNGNLYLSQWEPSGSYLGWGDDTGPLIYSEHYLNDEYLTDVIKWGIKNGEVFEFENINEALLFDWRKII